MLGIIEAIILLVFGFYRFGKKTLPLLAISSLLGVGLSFIRPSFEKAEYLSVVEEVKENYFIINSTFERMYVYQKDHPYEIGDILLIRGEKEPFDSVTIESGFNFKEYLNNKGIYTQMYPNDIKVKFFTPFRLHKIKKEFLNRFDSNSRALIGSFLFSMGSDEEAYEQSQNLHLNRLLSNSGFYLSLVYLLFSFILSYLIKKDKAKEGIVIALFIPILMFSFPRFVVIKFVFLKLIRWINTYLLKKKFSYLELISFSGIFFLLIDYHLAYQSVFILTYFIPIISLFFINSIHGFKKFKKRIVMTILILIAFIPFALDFYHEIAITSPLYQLILAPFFIIYYFLSLLSFIGIPIYSFLNSFGWFLSSVIAFFNKISIKIYGLEMNSLTIVLFENIYFVNVYYFASRFKPMLKISLTAFILYNSFLFVPYKNLFADQVSFINVGQGDATLIRSNKYSILIDTGGSVYQDIATNCLIPFLKKNRIYDIDLLITTHDDFDHSGAVDSLIDNFTVKRYVKDYQSFPITVGGITLYNYNVYPELWNEENDSSLVIGFKTNNYNYLVMGDAPKKIEDRIMKSNNSIPCDILKVGHHGSNTSTSDKFIKYLSPKIGIISCGKDNKYGHPADVVLSILKKNGVIIRRTDLEGTITYWQ